MENHVPDYMLNNMIQSKIVYQGGKPWWTNTSAELFSLKSAYELLRNICEDLKNIRCKDLPFKFSFLAWRFWRGRVSVAQ